MLEKRPSTPTRRRFLETSATAATTLVASSALAGYHPGGSDTIKIGLIGCGDRGTGAAFQAMQADPGVRLVAMADIFADRVAATQSYLQAQFPQQFAVDRDHAFVGFDAYRHVIEAADVVLIACASKFHPMYAEAAIAAGKHVFVEKPHGIDPLGVKRMEAACQLARTKQLSLVSGLQSRFHQGYRECVKRIHDGAIGDVVSIQSMFLRGPYRLNPREPGLTEVQSQFRNWYHFRWLSGDDVTQSLVHNMDRVAWILREAMPTSCFGLGGRSASFGEVYGDMFDHHTVVYEYPSGVRVYALCRTQDHTYGNSSDIISGTKGTCHLGPCVIKGENPYRYTVKPNDPYLDEQKALIAAVRAGQPFNSGDYMINSTMSVVLGQLACYTGQATTWDEVAHSDLGFGPAPDHCNFDLTPPTLPDATGNYPLPVPGVTEVLT